MRGNARKTGVGLKEREVQTGKRRDVLRNRKVSELFGGISEGEKRIKQNRQQKDQEGYNGEGSYLIEKDCGSESQKKSKERETAKKGLQGGSGFIHTT